MHPCRLASYLRGGSDIQMLEGVDRPEKWLSKVRVADRGRTMDMKRHITIAPKLKASPTTARCRNDEVVPQKLMVTPRRHGITPQLVKNEAVSPRIPRPTAAVAAPRAV